VYLLKLDSQAHLSLPIIHKQTTSQLTKKAVGAVLQQVPNIIDQIFGADRRSAPFSFSLFYTNLKLIIIYHTALSFAFSIVHYKFIPQRAREPLCE
jgi:hypothetical protein